LAVVGTLAALAARSEAAGSSLLYETTQMGPPDAGAGFAISQNQFLGARFQLTQPSIVDGVGGHIGGLSSTGNGKMFAALVVLDSLTDIPNSNNLSSPDVLTATTFSAATASADIIVPVQPTLVPAGYYAVVFGSGLFGATGGGFAPDNNVPNDLTAPYNLAYHAGSGWDVIGNRGVRFAAYGAVPEPATATVTLLFAGTTMLRRRARNVV
jgi:hypothetical protein